MGHVFYIGGVSATGKTSTATQLAVQYNLTLIEFDDYWRGIERFFKAEHKQQVMESIVRDLIIKLLESRSDETYIIEGVWLTPCVASILSSRYVQFSCVYCGYLNSNANERWEKIQAGDHWLVRLKNEQEAKQFLNEQIERSIEYYHHAGQYGLKFYDYSDFSQGNHAVKQYFSKWYHPWRHPIKFLFKLIQLLKEAKKQHRNS